MWPTRSGAPPRLLPYRSPQYWVVYSEFLVFEVLFGFAVLFAGVFLCQRAGRQALAELLDPRAPIHRLAKPLDAQDVEKRTVRRGGRLAGVDELCLVVHEYKSESWRRDWSATFGHGAWIELDPPADPPAEPSATALTRLDVDWFSVHWEPELVTTVSNREDVWRRRLEVPSGGRILEACLTAGTPVFVEGCLQRRSGGTVVSRCPEHDVVLTPGDGTPQPRIDALAARAAGQISLLGAALLLVLLYVWRQVSARPIVDALVERCGAKLRPVFQNRLLLLVGLTPVALFVVLMVARPWLGAGHGAAANRLGYLWAATTLAGTLVFMMTLANRHHALREVLAWLHQMSSAAQLPLTQGKRLVADAKVAPQAPLGPGPLSRRPRAFTALAITRIERSGKNYTAVFEPDRLETATLPIEILGTEAWLDMTHAVVDVRAIRRIVRKRAIVSGRFAHLLGSRPGFRGAFLLEERFLDPSEPLCICGQVSAWAPTSPGDRYRQGSEVPVIGGRALKPLFVHAGSLRSLRRLFIVERRFIEFALVLEGATYLSLAGLVVHLVFR